MQKLLLFVKKCLILVAAALLLFLLLHHLFPLPPAVTYSTIITDNKGNLLNAFLTDDDKWRMKTGIDEISPLLQKTIIAKEDRYFYEHPGVNLFAVARAAFNNITGGARTSGASTITMQVAKLMKKRRRTFSSKIAEAFCALQLEYTFSKKEILQLYLNLVPYGGNIEGIKAASLLYFKKAPDHLSLAEITALSIIPNRPSSLVIGRDNDEIVSQRNEWLKRFEREGVISQKDLADALAEPLTASRVAVPHYAPHLSYKLKSSAPAHRITTTIELNTQLKVEKIVEDYVRGLRLSDIRNAAVVVVDNATRNVVTYVGSASFSDTLDGGQVNGAAAVRQPGSTLKPLLYGICMDEGLLTPKRIIADVPVNYNGYAPENYDQTFNGAVTVEYALEHSLNIPAVRSFKELGKERMVQKLSAAGFQEIRKNREKLGLSLILGGCGTTLEELTGLFASFANGGRYTQPYFVSGGAKHASVSILSPVSSYMITDILTKVNRPDFPLNWAATEHMPKIAWKTGTSYGRRDAWSIGYNKRYTVGVWVGNFSGTGVQELSGANTASPLLFKIFNTIDYQNDGDWFSPPDEIDWRQVCSETGLLPGPHCTNLVLDAFIPLTSTTAPCTHLQEVKISVDGSVSFCAGCAPRGGYRKAMYTVPAADLLEFYKGSVGRPAAIPPHYTGCETIFKGEGPRIVSPLEGSEYYISKEEKEPIRLSAAAPADVTMLYWYVNDVFYSSAPPNAKLFYMPLDGPQKISCTDDKGRNRNVNISVKWVDL